MKKIILISLIVIVALGLIGIIWYNTSLTSVSNAKNGKEIVVEIPEGYRVFQIADLLKENEVIKSKLSFKIYAKLNNKTNMQAGKYLFNNGTDNVEAVINKLANGEIYNEEVKITFVEGKNMRYIAKLIAEKTNNTEEDVFALLENEEYIDSLIQKYWFLTDEIKNENIYYPLEGYLLPDTYIFENKDVSVETIFNIILNFMDKYLTEKKQDLADTGITVHQVLTFASMAELEGNSDEDRSEIVGVFYNRISKNMSLGSDVTTYYAFKVDMGERNLTSQEINTYNPYNTRGPKANGKIPVGPICNPSKSAIEAAMHPTKTNNLYFVADKNGKVYFTKSNDEHNKKIKELKDQGLWFTYDN